MNKLQKIALVTFTAFTVAPFFSCGKKPAPDPQETRRLYGEYYSASYGIQANSKKVDSLNRVNEDISGKNTAGVKQELRLPLLIRNKILIDSINTSTKTLEGRRSKALDGLMNQ